MLLIKAGGYRASSVLGLYRDRPLGLGGAVIAGATMWILLGTYVQFVQKPFLPETAHAAEKLQQLLFGVRRPLLVDLAAIALLPAICEEILFRGLLLRSSMRVMSTVSAVALNGLLFGAFHLSIYRLFPQLCWAPFSLRWRCADVHSGSRCIPCGEQRCCRATRTGCSGWVRLVGDGLDYC